MRLVKQSRGSWRYHLNQNEADILLGLAKKFPFTEMGPIKISKTDKGPATLERGKLLNESLADHRKALKALAINLLGTEKWQPSGKGQLLTLDSASREILLQILNDIRVGCWHAIGEPESLEHPTTHSSTKDAAYRNLMDLSGYFEAKFLETEAGKGSC